MTSNEPPSWIQRQWHDIKGNFKWWVLTVAGAGLVAVILALIDGLPLWKKLVFSAGFIYLLVWAAIATWLARSPRQSERHGHNEADQELENARREVKRLTEGVDLLQSKLQNEQKKVQTLEQEKLVLEASKRRLEADKKEFAEVNDRLRRSLGNLQLCLSGLEEGAPRNQSVLIRIVDLDDLGLAKEIRDRFLTCNGIPQNSPWTVEIDPERPIRENPTSDARIVITSSDHATISTLKSVFNQYDLISEHVTAAQPRPEDLGSADIVITIYPNE